MPCFTVRKRKKKEELPMFNLKVKILGICPPTIVLFLLLQCFNLNCSKVEEELKTDSIVVVHPIYQGNGNAASFPGQLKPWFEAPMYAQVSGYVKTWHKDYGASVEKGEVLAEIYAPTVDANYHQSVAEWDAQKARYQLAEITAKRYDSLKESKAVSEQSISVAQATQNAEWSTWKATEQEVKKHSVLLSFKSIRAPFAGVITQRNINIGDYVNKDGNLSEVLSPKNLFTIADIHKLRLFVSVPDTYLPLINEKLKVGVSISQYPNQKFQAKFLNYARGFDANSQTVLVQFILENEDQSIWPGSYATVHWDIESTEKTLRIPTSSLVFDESGTRVATITENNRVHFKSIEIAKVTDRYIEVKSGLLETDMVIQNPKTYYLEQEELPKEKIIFPLLDGVRK